MNHSPPVLLDDGQRKYVWGLGLAYAVDTTGAVQVYHTDGLGSVRAITDASGSVVQTYQTDAFGVETQSQGLLSQPFQYTGEPRDAETGFIYLRARVYDPQVGRFLQRDPLPGFQRAPASLNRYSYTANNPCRFTDPSGMRREGVCPLGIVIGTSALATFGTIEVGLAAATALAAAGGVTVVAEPILIPLDIWFAYATLQAADVVSQSAQMPCEDVTINPVPFSR